MKYVVDFDDLCDERDPWAELMALKAQYPELKVTLFAIPGRCSDSLLAKYTALNWVQLGVHGYWHSSMECAIWTYEETLAKLAEIAAWWPGARLFKAPGWIANEEVYRALCDDGWNVADHTGHRHRNLSLTRGYVYNDDLNTTTSIHGHTWDVCDNGPTAWPAMFADVPNDASFLFVTEVCAGRSYLYKNGFSLRAGDLIVDVGAFIGEEIQFAVEAGCRIESYEPSLIHYEACQKLLVPGCTVHRAAVGGSVGKATYYVPGEGNYASGGSLVPIAGSPESYEVPVLDALDVVMQHDKIALLKIDAEGCEWDILGRLCEEPDVFSRLTHIAVEDHSRKYAADDVWSAKRDAVLAKLNELGVVLEVWP